MAVQPVERKPVNWIPIVLIAVGLLALTGVIFGVVGRTLFELFTGKELPELFVVEAPHVRIPASNLLNASNDFAMPANPLQFALTNTMLSSLLATFLLLLLFIPVGLGAKLIPTRLQGLLESLMEWMLTFCESVAGQHLGRRLFPIIFTIFLFVSFNAWVGLLPIYEAIAIRHPAEGPLFFISLMPGQEAISLLRPAGTDLNMPMALALISFFLVEGLGFAELRFHYLGKFFRFGGFRKKGPMMGAVDVFVGILELLSEFIRLVSFSFRLFGNMTAGVVLLLVITFLVPFVFSILFYGLELLVGAVQALVFAGLTLVFATMAIQPHGDDDGHGEAHQAAAHH